MKASGNKVETWDEIAKLHFTKTRWALNHRLSVLIFLKQFRQIATFRQIFI